MSVGRASPKMLHVSNDRSVWRQLRGCLSALGLTAGALTAVRNGRECFTALTRTRPCLVVLDDSITDLDAQDLLRAVRRHDPEVLVVYLATCHTAELERAVRRLGVLYYTEKPPDPLLFEKILGSVFASTTRTLGDGGPFQGGKRARATGDY
jgi:DNA-binding NtrC family response regulator